jgi:hypothetical protein
MRRYEKIVGYLLDILLINDQRPNIATEARSCTNQRVQNPEFIAKGRRSQYFYGTELENLCKGQDNQNPDLSPMC